MRGAIHHRRLTDLLEHLSARLEGLLLEVRRPEANPLPAELIDEIASTAGELMLVLIDHQSVHKIEEDERQAVSHAQRLRQGVRSRTLQREEIAEVVHALAQEVGRIIREDKRAA